MQIKSKLTKVQKIALCFLILANLLMGSYVLYSRQPAAVAEKRIPAFELTENTVVRKRIDELLAKNQTQKIAVVLLSAASTACTTGTIVDVFKKAAQHSSGEKFAVYLPNQFNRQDVENFKTNFNFNLNVEKADDELAQQWLPLVEKYEALGVVIISDNGKISVLQDVDEIKKQLSTF